MNLRVGVVLSHPFHVGLGTDFRIVNQVYPLETLGARLTVISPFKKPEVQNSVSYLSLSRYPSIYESFYRFTRNGFNSPLLARLFLRSSHYLQWSVESYARKLENAMSSEEIDVFLAVHQIAAAACCKLRRKMSIPVVADVHGLWSEEIVASQALKSNSKQAKVVSTFERELLREVDRIIVVSDELRNSMATKFDLDKGKINVVNPCAFPRVQEPKSRVPSRIVCAATNTYREGLELLLRSMKIVQSKFPEAELFLTKKGELQARVKQMANELDIHPHYSYYPRMGDFLNFLASCDIGIITSLIDVTRVVSYPAKLYDYMSVGLPIIANDVGGWCHIIKESGAGMLTESSPEALADAICFLMSNPERAQQMGKNGLNYLRWTLRPEKTLDDFYNVLLAASLHGVSV